MQKEDLLNKTPADLDQLFTSGVAAPIPSGNAAGEVVLWKGTFWDHVIARLAHDLAWQGKIFTPNPEGGGATLINKLGPDGVHGIVARVYTTRQAGSTGRTASSSTTQRPRSWPRRSATRSA
jgi:hypothetical protein